jgi:hypothetical protein
MTISALQPGQRFALVALPERQGTLVRLGPYSAIVRFRTAKTCAFTAHASDPSRRTAVRFSAPEPPRAISLETEVTEVAP